MEFEIRGLQARDVAPMTRIMSKIGVKDVASALSPESLKEIVSGAATEADEGSRVQVAGLNLVLELATIVCENFHKAESDLFKFLASMAGMKEKEVAELPLPDVLDLVVAVFSSEGFMDFFRRVQALLAK